MKTLIVQYLPSGANSNTKKLLEVFLNNLKNLGKAEIVNNLEIVDLLKISVPFFDENSIQSYYKRNYGGQNLSDSEAKLLEHNDILIKQIKSADRVVIACPMHNFGLPALVKAYIDAVVFFNETFAYDQKMMAGKKIVTLYTSGGEYTVDKFNFEYPNWDAIRLNTHAVFGFMGFDEVKTIGTSLRGDENLNKNLPKVSAEIAELVKNWYNN